MAEGKIDLRSVTFEDVLEGNVKGPDVKTPDVKLPDKTELKDTLPDDEPKVEPKTEPKKEDTPSEEESIFEGLQKILGYEIEGEYEESVEGVAEYTKTVAQKIAEEEVKDLFEAFPDVKEYLQFRLNDGDPAKYFESKYGDTDFSKYQITEADEITQEIVVRKYLASQEHSEEQINDIIKDYKETGLLFKTAKRAADKLTEVQRVKREQLTAKQAEAAREAELQKQEMVGEITTTIDSGKLHTIVIPEKDRREFKSWLLNPNAKGQTKRQEAMSKLTMQQKLELEYLAFKGFNFGDLVKKEATQTKVNLLKKSVQAKGSKLGTGGREPQFKKPGDLTGIKVSDLI